LYFCGLKSHLFKKNSSHTKNQLNGYNIKGDINGRPVHTIRTYGPLKRPVRTGGVYRPLQWDVLQQYM